MTYSLDVESFINEIKKRPEIWDPNCEDNRYKNRKQRAWSDVARLFIEEFDAMEEVDKLDVFKKLHGKWRNIRDSFVRYRKRPSKKSYMYARHLTFLNKIYEGNSGSEAEVENDSNSNQHWGSDDDSKVIKNKRKFQILNDSNWSDEDPPSTIDNLKRKRVPNLKTEEVEFVDTPFTENLTSEDDDRSFFESLLPAVRSFNLDQKLEFRSQVLGVVKNIRYTGHVIEIKPSPDS